jgi:hypothetical protein
VQNVSQGREQTLAITVLGSGLKTWRTSEQGCMRALYDSSGPFRLVKRKFASTSAHDACETDADTSGECSWCQLVCRLFSSLALYMPTF